jgi:hypothetical protein
MFRPLCPEKGFLVTYSRDNNEFNQITLEAWIKTDRSIYAKQEMDRPNGQCLILGAFATQDEADNYCEGLMLNRRECVATECDKAQV